jgi:NAD(P)-dependent dehydrogenase (short-subunit alcohol dehydrogenase family)
MKRKNKIAVITGGSAGVGRAIVREFAGHGYDVAVLARGRRGVDGAVHDAGQAGVRALGIPTDVSVLADVEAAAVQVERELGPIDVWINDAFVGGLRFFWDTDDETFRRITDVTYLGTVNGTRTALAHMRPRNRGVVVQVGSALGFRGIPLQAAYCGAKHAIKGFTESVITELGHEHSEVRVCMVQLPAVNTPQFDWNDSDLERHPMPVKPIFQPEVPARAVRYIAEHPRRNIWVGASTAATILGNRIAPRLLDRYLGRTGVDGQLTDEQGPRLGSNVEIPRDDDIDVGAHGMFDAEAHPHDPWSWASMHRSALGASAVVAAVAAGVAAATTPRHR